VGLTRDAMYNAVIRIAGQRRPNRVRHGAKAMTSSSTQPFHSFPLEEASEHLKLIGLVTVNRAHLGRTCCRLMGVLSGIVMPTAKSLPEVQALSPALGSKEMEIQILSSVAERKYISEETLKQVESCLATLKRCVDIQEEMENTCYGIGHRGLVLSPTSDECGMIVPVARNQLQQLADDMANCNVELDRLTSTVWLHEGRQYARTEDVNALK
jgi:hypothetical protein